MCVCVCLRVFLLIVYKLINLSSYICVKQCEMESDEMNDGATTPKPCKATWKAEFHEMFLDLCIEQINAGNKPGTHFTREGWRNIEESFMNNTGVFYERKQFKNHWDNTKEQWKIWRKLIETGSMKWDPHSRKFGAREDEWATYIQVRMINSHKRLDSRRV